METIESGFDTDTDLCGFVTSSKPGPSDQNIGLIGRHVGRIVANKFIGKEYVYI